MAIKNKTRYAVLGVLSLKPCSGYDIKKFCDKTISHFWNENFGHIYPVLNQLQEEGLIRQQEEEERDRRKTYRITEEGRREFSEWLLQPVVIQPPRSELLLKLSFGSSMPKDKILDMLNEVKERHSSNLKKYRELEENYTRDANVRRHPEYNYWLAPLRFGIMSSETTLAWCEETIRNLQQSEDMMK